MGWVATGSANYTAYTAVLTKLKIYFDQGTVNRNVIEFETVFMIAGDVMNRAAYVSCLPVVVLAQLT